MWKPDGEQEARILRVGGSLLVAVRWAWEIDGEGRVQGCGPCSGGPAIDYRNFAEEPLSGRFGSTLARIAEKHRREELELAMPELLAYPLVWSRLTSEPRSDREASAQMEIHIARSVAAAFVIDHPSSMAVDLLGRRLGHILAHPYRDVEIPGTPPCLPPGGYLFPDAGDCIDLLCRLTRHPDAIAWLEDFVSGRLNAGPIELPSSLGKAPLRAYEIHKGVLLGVLPGVMDRLHQLGLLDEEALRRAAKHLPLIGSLPVRASHPFSRSSEGYASEAPLSSPEAMRLFAGYAWKLACDLDEETAPAYLCTPRPQGMRFLLLACEHIERRGLRQLVKATSMLAKGRIEEALAHMADIERLDGDDRTECVAGRLRAFRAETLLAVLPVAGAGTSLVLRALGWEGAIPLVLFIRRLARLDERPESLLAMHDVPNSAIAAEGTLDRDEVVALLAGAGEERALEIFEAMEAAGLPVKRTRLLLEAVLGANRKAVVSALSRRGQAAIKAYGLLPLENRDELLERYLKLKEIARTGKRGGGERQANEAAAVEAALAHLAQTAGYDDARRLEWDMELLISKASAPPRGRFEVGKYEIEISAAEPSIVITRGGKPLRSVPKAVRDSPAYARAKEARGRIQEQGRRFADALENHLQTGKALTLEDLEIWRNLPIALTLLSRVVLVTADGRLGLLDADGHRLEGLNAERSELCGAVSIAHPIRAYWAGQLSAWQRHLCARGVAQPVRQVFREIYFPADDEGASATCTRRFAGHQVNARQAAKLLQRRGWRFESGDHSVPYKVFPELRIQAVLDFPDSGHYLTETESLTSGEVYFLEHPLEGLFSRRTHEGRGRLPLSRIPGLVFSEALRDADLALTVARLEDGAPLSREAIQKRGEVVLALAAVLELGNVAVRGHFLHVQGRLATYKVHLGTCCVYAEAGGQLLDVPGLPDRMAAVVCPLAGAEGAWLSEIMTRTAVLSRDDEIEDPAIRRRLRAGG